MSVGLTEIETMGLKTLILLRLKKLDSFQCWDCTEDMREQRNCACNDNDDKPVFYYPEVGEYYACPLKFISESILEFIDRYDFYEKYPTSAPSYEEVNPRFWEALKFYESFTFNLEHDNKHEKDSESSDDNLAKMKTLFKK